MRFIKNLLIVSAAMFTAAFLQACFSDSNADSKDSGLTKAEVEAMIAEAIAPLQAEITALKSGSGGGSAPYNRLYVEMNSSDMAMKATAADEDPIPLTDLGDPFGCEGPDANIFACRIVSPTGALAKIPLNRNPTIPGRMLEVFYALPDCQGDAYVQGQTNRIVVTSTGDGQVWYHSASSPYAGVITAVSYWETESGCANFPMSDREAYRLLPNDPATTGIENSYNGSVRLGRSN